MKKILFTIYTFSTGGGAEKILSNLLKNLDTEKFQIDVLPYAEYGITTGFIPDGVNLLPSIVDLTKASKVEKALKYFLVHFFPRILKKRYAPKKYDIEVSFNYQIPSFLVKETSHTKTIEWIHGEISDLKSSKLKYLLQKRSFKRATKIITISENSKNSILELFPEFADKLQIIYNGIDTENILSLSKQECEEKLKSPSILFAGRIEEEKQPFEILKAIKILKDRKMAVNAYFIGTGKHEEEFKQAIKDLEVTDRAFYLGFKSNPYPYFAQCDAVCLLSKSEGFPTIFLEGMVLGKPFISTTVGGVKELSFDGKCGIIANNPQECAEAIEKIVIDKDKNSSMSDFCLEHIKNFTLQKNKEHIEKLFETV